jgi:hypothetical protein
MAIHSGDIKISLVVDQELQSQNLIGSDRTLKTYLTAGHDED